jgi:energy-coupling factor transporter transmembrane protein EcfT
MARLAFTYQADSPASRWDIRGRVTALGVFSVAVLAVPAWNLLPLALLLVALLVWTRMPLASLGRLVAQFGLFLAFFFGVGLLLVPTASQAELLGVQSARLLMLLLASQFLMLTATPDTVTAGIQWFLRPLGTRRAYLGASMASWALASVPRVLDDGSTLVAAARLRGLEVRKRPLAWMQLVTLGLLVRVVERSAAMAQALEARSFGLAVPPHGLKATIFDVGLTAAVCAWCGVWLVLR